MRRTIIIAEAGVNHNGSLDLAKQLIDVASEAGADFVKFQTFKTELCISKEAPKAIYQIENAEKQETQFEMVKKLELDELTHNLLNAYCQEKNIGFLSTAFDLESADLLEKYKLPFYKIPSGEITNLPYLRKTGSFGKPIVLSTGMANMGEVEQAIDVLCEAGVKRDEITVLHCNTEYPTPMSDVNLKAMLTIKNALKVDVGYSDHTMGIEVPIAAVALGAKVIEKHFTLDRNMEGPDHKASLEPEELKSMVKSIRNIELAMSGNGLKKPSLSEEKNIIIARKSLFFNKSLKAGYTLKLSDFSTLRPASGISPMQIDDLVGRTLATDVKEGQMVAWKQIG
ncbi:MAG: N,N'-diacetyllegionaminate synthase [Arenicella sp.]|jgi:N,N'-diacetyllegionaminate synthase